MCRWMWKINKRKLFKRIRNIERVINRSKKKIIIYKNEYIEVRKENHTYIFDLANESLTISKLFSRYIYENYKQIALVTDAAHHPSQRSVFIKIQDNNAIKLMIKAYNDIIKDLNSIRKDFIVQ